jgi:riboflavin biosynthesis pyrimidine reductase
VIKCGDLSQLDDVGLRGLYAYPAGGLTVRANMVASVDGAATLGGTSGGLSTPSDRRVFELLRGLAELIVVGAGTVRAEGYGVDRKMAIVTGSLDLDPASEVFSSGQRHLVIGCQRADPRRLAELAEVAEVWLVGERAVELPRMLRLLEQRGYRQVLCEGGPRLLGQLVADQCLHELCLTVSPVLVGSGAAPRIIGAFGKSAARVRLHHALTGDDAVFLRYSLSPGSLR